MTLFTPGKTPFYYIRFEPQWLSSHGPGREWMGMKMRLMASNFFTCSFGLLPSLNCTDGGIPKNRKEREKWGPSLETVVIIIYTNIVYQNIKWWHLHRAYIFAELRFENNKLAISYSSPNYFNGRRPALILYYVSSILSFYRILVKESNDLVVWLPEYTESSRLKNSSHKLLCGQGLSACLFDVNNKSSIEFLIVTILKFS